MVARVLFPWHPSWWKTIASPPTGDHQGPPNLSSTTLAPTDRPASCLTSRLRLMRRGRHEWRPYRPPNNLLMFIIGHISERKETMRKIPELQTLMTGLAFGESPRWHADRLWFSDWGAQEVIAVDLEGKSEVIVRVPTVLPFCIDWLADGRLLIVSGRNGLLLRRELDGSLVTHADLTSLSDHPWNEIVVDGRGNACINDIGFACPGGEFTPGLIALANRDCSAG